MEIVSKNDVPVSFKNAVILEKKGELKKAVQMYDRLLKKAPSDLVILSRLMIICRKLKNYGKEITYINQAIKVHESKYEKLKSKDVKVVALSKKLNTLLGHTDKRGKNLLSIPEVVQLTKRKTVAQKRMK